MNLARSTGVFVVLLLAALPGQAEDQEKAKLKGTWVPTRLKQNGKDKERGWKEMQFTFQEDKLLWKGILPSDPEREETLTYSINAAKSPREMDIQFQGGAVLRCIYEINGDELKLCMAEGRDERPKELDSKEGSLHVLLIFKRGGK